MKKLNKNSLLEFYFGGLDEDARIEIEKQLLVDPELLLDYLDLKREIEAAKPVPQQASPALWQRLQPSHRKKSFYLVVGGLLAASLAGFYFWNLAKVEINTPTTEQAILFDSGAEHSIASDVL